MREPSITYIISYYLSFFFSFFFLSVNALMCKYERKGIGLSLRNTHVGCRWLAVVVDAMVKAHLPRYVGRVGNNIY